MKNKNYFPNSSAYSCDRGVSFKQQAALDIFCAMVSCPAWVDPYKLDELRELAIEQADLLVDEIPE